MAAFDCVLSLDEQIMDGAGCRSPRCSFQRPASSSGGAGRMRYARLCRLPTLHVSNQKIESVLRIGRRFDAF